MGFQYKVSDSWFRLRNIRERRERLSKLARELRVYADLLEYKEPEINKEVGNDES